MRIDLHKTSPAASRAMFALQAAVTEESDRAGLDPEVRELVKIRASQLNGCVFCLDMHIAEARKQGVGEQRLDLLAAWREADLYSESERAALALTEAVTNLPAGIPDDVWEDAAEAFTEEQLSALVWAATSINAWNRLGVTAQRSVPRR
ncbi:carboxymuconolactone decarboxylase family protein [Saccharopolyspora sp. K220]|uniref:carboxymuconolactone decarboxylase family protein n=1 Tax=Saccharopolyspora soli TaxID=2926618 RepID=UPI001F57C428|nr:carboxymuconolactone decarboxylase family protein [Saccharopolyspora soli]MCI2417111.1 carboxymuconolactone decarboxylase family protein [Saccharopolyspora soli]